jgi:hypothetical protein
MENLYQELFKTYQEKSGIEYEKHVEIAKAKLEDKDFKYDYESFIPYPTYANKQFNEIIYKKEEFHRNKSRFEKDKNTTYDDIVKDKCMGEFKLTPNQKLIKNFISPLTPYRSLLIYHSVGVGKCHAYDTPILMHDGSIKLVQDIMIGDTLMGDDSSARTVLSLAQGEDVLYDIIQSNGMTYRVNSEHILVLKGCEDNSEIHEIEVRNYLTLPDSLKKGLYGYSTFVEFPELETEIDPFYAAEKFDENIHIPKEYLYNSVKKRMKYFFGLVNNFGNLQDEVFIIYKQSADLTYLGRSLGFNVKTIYAMTGSEEVPYTRFHKDTTSRIMVNEVGRGKYYGFTLDGNHRYLLGDFTVTHNTCTAINIAEKYYDTHEKRVLVILSGNIEDNFRKQIYDINRAQQCTGQKYPNMIIDKNLLNKEALEVKINAIIKQRYEFVGYKELAIYMETRKRKINEQIKDPVDPSKMDDIILRRKTLYEETIKERFSNRLMIIDEAHNLRLPSETGDKQISKAFLELMNIIENVKLVLMTATPMYNTADEIVWMMNLLLTNDRAKTIKRSDLFDKDSNLTTSGEKILRDKCRGYVSYMRGENPFSFPFRLFPSINNKTDPNILKTYPKKDIYGEVIPDESKVKFLEIITSKMSAYQYEIYNSFKRKDLKEVMDNQDPDYIEPEFIAEEDKNNDVQNTMQVSNVVYPAENWKQNSRVTYGLTGFNSCFDVSNNRVFHIKYKEQVKEKYGEFLSYEHLDKYAPKIKTLIDYIVKAKGIVFIYSRYYGAGLFPLACALEHIGMSRYSADGKNRNIMEKISITDKVKMASKFKYCVLSRKQELSPDNDKEIDIAKSAANMNGDIIKVIIVSKIGTEGIDFKMIREVHILEPWYNLNRAEQIIGRAVRTCSHVNLPKEDRNVTIYFHANVCGSGGGDEESVDLRTYRISENKQKRIIAVENILKESSIDCNLNREVLLYPVKLLNMKFDINTSQGKTIKNYEIGDRDNSFICGFKPCNFKCTKTFPELKKSEIDTTTFDTEFILTDIDLMKQYISNLYISKNIPRTYDDILTSLNKEYKLIENEIVSFALEDMIELKHVIHLEKGTGYLIYKSDKYILQYEKLQDIRIPLEDRRGQELSDKDRRLELDITKIKNIKYPAALAEVPVVAKEDEPVEDKPAEVAAFAADVIYDKIYMNIYSQFVLFLFDIESKFDDIKNLRYYLENKPDKSKSSYEKIIYNYILKMYAGESTEGAVMSVGEGIIQNIKEHVDKYERHIYDSILDRLSPVDLFAIIKDRTNSAKAYAAKLYDAMIRANIIFTTDYVLSSLDKKLYKLNKNKSVVECSPMDYIKIKELNDAYNKFKASIKDINKDKLDNIRYYTRWQKNKLVFKIRETNITLGAICDTAPKKEELILKIERHIGKKLNMNNNLLEYNKANLCVILEVLIRADKEFYRALYLQSK